MPDHTGITLRAWRFLLADGGRWGVVALAKELDCPSRPLGHMICTMVRNGLLVQHPRTPTFPHLSYTVTPDCRIPRGITLAEVRALMEEAA